MRFSWFTHISMLNPFNSLFGRIFLWFWLTTLVIIFVTATVVRHYITSDDLQSVPNEDQVILNSTAERVIALANNPRPAPVRRVLMNVQRESGGIPLLLRHSDDRIFHIRPIPPQFESRFISLKGATTPYGFLAHNNLFIGPKQLQINQRSYSLFIGKPLRFPLLQHNKSLLLGTAILISGLLCFALTWQLTQPIKHLRTATQSMAKGDLQARVEFANNRRDEIGQLSRDFNTMSEKVNTLVNGQKRLLADISHELRSPLARLQLAIGIAQEQPSEENIVAMMARIEKEAHQIDVMLGQVLQLARLENQTMQAKIHPVSLAPLLQPIIDDATYEASCQDKQLLSHIDDIKCQVAADQQLFASGVENVLRNAIKYAKHTVSFHCSHNDNEVTISIEDDGDGVPQQDLTNLFTAFFRISTARGRDSGGTGLGLAIAKQAINVHNGTIEAKNSSKGGLIVTLRIPSI